MQSGGSRRGSDGSMETPFQGEPKMYSTLKAEKHAACLKCKINLPTLTIRGLKA